MTSVIEKLPLKIWSATKQTSLMCYQFLKNWVDKKNREELERQIRQQYVNNAYFLSNQIHEIFSDKGVKEHFQYRIEPVYEDREVQNDGIKEFRKVQVDEEFYPIFVDEQVFRVSDDFNIIFEYHRFFFAGRLDSDVLVNLRDRWRSINAGKEVEVGLLQVNGTKCLVFVSFVKSLRSRVSKYFFEHRIYD